MADTKPLPLPHFYLSLDQVRDSGLLTPARLAEIEAAIEARLSMPQDAQGRPIENARLADFGEPYGRFLFPRMDHESNWEYAHRQLLSVVLTAEERDLLSKHALGTAAAKRATERYAKATKVAERDWTGGVFWGDTYYSSTEDLNDALADEHSDDWPEYVWAARPQRIIQGIGAEEVVENCLDAWGWDEMTVDDLEGVAALRAALEVFEKANEDVVSYQEDTTTAIVLDKA